MTVTDQSFHAKSELPERSEVIAQAFTSDAEKDPEALSPQDLLKLIHELRVSQIKLEMQNDQLRSAQVEFDKERARYCDFYDLAPVGYVTVNARGLILNANLTSARQLGLTRPELLKHTLDHFIHREDQDRFYWVRQKVIATQTPQSSEFRLVKGDAELWVQLDAVATTDDSGAPVLWLVLIDISERKRLEDRLIRDKTKLKTILDGAPDAILINDIRGNFQYANEQAAQMLDYGRDELLGMCVTDITPVEDEARTRRMLAELMTKGSLRYEPTIRRRDGSTLMVELSGRLLADGSGFAACREITERIQRQTAQVATAVESESATWRQQLRELVALNEAKREEERKHIAREVHDELGQVLAALRINLALTRARFGRLDSTLNTDLKCAKALVDRAIHGVRDVATNLRPVALDMGLVPAIKWLLQEFRRANTRTTCSLDAQGRLDLDELRAVVVFRIVQESLTNIIRHAKASRVDVTLCRQGCDLRLTVCDNGSGFDVNAAAKKHAYGLMGMRERAIALGGGLDITGEPGTGTVVGLTIPYQIISTTGQTLFDYCWPTTMPLCAAASGRFLRCIRM